MTNQLGETQQGLLSQMTHLQALDGLVPPMLEEAIGYSQAFLGKLPMMRFVGFYWQQCGDEVMVDDGATSATGDWGSYLLYTQHHRIAPYLCSYDFGSSEEEPVHYLVLDQEERKLYAAPVRIAGAFLIAQHIEQALKPHPGQALSTQFEPPVVESLEELLQQISNGTGWQEVAVDQQQVMAAMRQAQDLYQAMALWLEQPPEGEHHGN